MDELISTAEAARLAGVGPTTVKRWAEEGVLPCLRTAGGHRRFRRSDVERFLRAASGTRAGEDGDTTRWLDRILADEAYDLESALLSARARTGAWFRVANALDPVIVGLGLRWAENRITILQEHVGSERIARALAWIGQALPWDPNAPRALLACAQGEDHTLGLSLAELCLRELGWSVAWAGRRTPLDDLEAAARSGGFHLIGLSASAMSQDGPALAEQAEQLAAACVPHGALLVLGGSGAWPEHPRGAVRVREFTTFHQLAKNRMGLG